MKLHVRDVRDSVIACGLAGAGLLFSAGAQASSSFTGTVEQVWEDGFRLNIGDQQLEVDAYDLCGDLTASHLSGGERLTVSGEFEEGEFDAFTITKSDGSAVCR